MKKSTVCAILTGAVLLAGLSYAGPSILAAEDDVNVQQTKKRNFRAHLNGAQEVPAISTLGSGTFKAKLNKEGTLLEYELSYSGLQGNATAAHIHFGQFSVNGGIVAFLCGGGNKSACPVSGTVTGTVNATDVIGPAAQGIAPGEFSELVAALRAGLAYANVHSNIHPGGEIRGQIDVGKL